MAQQKPPAQKQPQNTVQSVLAYSRRFVLYGFAISILLHGLFGPFVDWKPSTGGTPEPVYSVSIKTVVHTPRPTPPPTPTPTPPPKQTPPPQTPPPHQVQKLLVHPPKTTAENNSGPAEQRYTNTQGSESGVPQGNANTGPPATVPGTATPAPTPTKPACAVPNAPATATNKVTPDMPEIARQMGASGTAQVKVTLDANGAVLSATIATSTHNSALDRAAIQAAQQSKYAPEIDNCVKTGGSYLYVVTFESQ
jgi:periplasmic protein TonB